MTPMTNEAPPTITRKAIYFAMFVLLAVICIGAYRQTHPIYLAVGFIGELMLVSTAHLSSVIQSSGVPHSRGESQR